MKPAKTDQIDSSEAPTETEAASRHALHHDAFARAWIDDFGTPPSPEDRRDFFKRYAILIKPDDATENRRIGDLLITGDRAGGVAPYDPDEEARLAAERGIDLTVDPDWQHLKELVRAARKRAGAREMAAARKTLTADTRQKDRAAASRTEARLRKDARRDEVAAKGNPSSRTSRESWRRDVRRDLSILHEIKGFFDVHVGVRLVATKASLVHPPKVFPSTTIATSEHHTPDPVFVLPHWEKTTLPMRMFGMAVAAGRANARDFTLHLNDDVLAYALAGDGKSFAKRMLRRLKDTFADELPATAQPIDFFFVVERGPREKPHLHGVIIIPEGRSSLDAVRTALRKAGGQPWKRGRHVDTQVDVGGLPEPIGWVTYISKFKEVTKAEVGTNTFAATMGMRRSGRDWYQSARKRAELLLPGKAVPFG